MVLVPTGEFTRGGKFYSTNLSPAVGYTDTYPGTFSNHDLTPSFILVITSVRPHSGSSSSYREIIIYWANAQTSKSSRSGIAKWAPN